jgi:molecular chaperone DnaK (HSP70)
VADEREFDPLLDERPSRYVVGIDLGTTNSAVAYVDVQETPWRVRDLAIPQLVAPSQVEARETLPSFHYQAAAAEAAAGSLRLPWSDADPSWAVGFFARDQGTLAPGRLIVSAKSWLCHAGVDRTADILPWQGAADVDRLSPIEVTARYLLHIRDAWDFTFRGAPLAEQQVVVTLPASFDEVARELTVSAAAEAGLPRIVLIEEPQAAFYAWVYRHADDWHERVEPGQRILVCDIGGGTTDFTLIHVRAAERSDGQVQFHRVAVGNHLILGGDNLDLALAHRLERKLAGEGQLPPHQWDVLVRSSRRVKETLLGEDAPERTTLSLPSGGTKVIGGALQVEVERQEVEQLLVDGFLPFARLDEKPRQRQSGFQEFGLPYASDHAITRYLAAFLQAHAAINIPLARGNHAGARPDVVLFNGGFFASPILRERLLKILSSWFSTDETPWKPLVLDNDRLDLAVARGAAYYGMVQRGQGVRIAANLARSYYIGVEGDVPMAVCLIPGHAEPGSEIELPDMTFHLRISEPVEFPLYVSSTRLADQPGQVVAIDPEQTTPLPPIRTVLRAARKSALGDVPVLLHARLTEIGTIELWCSEVGSNRTWRLQFDVRSTTQTDIDAHQSAAEAEGIIDEHQWLECRNLIAGVFASGGKNDPAGVMKRLTQALDSDRNQWPTSLLRRIWEALMEHEAGRQRSAAHEARWLNLLGFALRPGYGLAMDDWRVAETWRSVHGKLTLGSGEQALILWRRVAGGLSRGQQRAIAEPLVSAIRDLRQRFAGGAKGRAAPALSPDAKSEVWRLVGSLELLPVPMKIELGDAIVELLPKRKLQGVRDAMVWALGRIGQRTPLYGPLNTVVPDDKAAEWLRALIAHNAGGPVDLLSAMQLARRTDDRRRDLPEPSRREAADWVRGHGGRDHLVNLILEGGRLDAEEQTEVFGESLPHGLKIA